MTVSGPGSRSESPFPPWQAKDMDAKEKQTSCGFTAASRSHDACVDFVPAYRTQAAQATSQERTLLPVIAS